MTTTHATSHGDPHAHGAAHAPGSAHAHPNYLLIFGILIVLTIASVIADMAGGTIGKVMVGLIVLAVASLKAMYVMAYFMHLKFEGAWKYVLLAPTVVLALAVPAALAPDIAYKYYDAQNPQQKAYQEEIALHHAAEHSADHHPAHNEATGKHPEHPKDPGSQPGNRAPETAH